MLLPASSGVASFWIRFWRRRGLQPVGRGRHDHVDLLFAASCLRLTDPRRFGALHDTIIDDYIQRINKTHPDAAIGVVIGIVATTAASLSLKQRLART